MSYWYTGSAFFQVPQSYLFSLNILILTYAVLGIFLTLNTSSLCDSTLYHITLCAIHKPPSNGAIMMSRNSKLNLTDVRLLRTLVIVTVHCSYVRAVVGQLWIVYYDLRFSFSSLEIFPGSILGGAQTGCRVFSRRMSQSPLHVTAAIRIFDSVNLEGNPESHCKYN